MDENITRSFEPLGHPEFAPSVEAASAWNGSSVVADFGDEDDDSLADDFGVVDEVDGEDSDRSGSARGSGRHAGGGENTALVNKVFAAAGNPRFQDVRFKTVATVPSSDPTHRELMLKQAQRTTRVDWG
jgi:hypothetical protein